MEPKIMEITLEQQKLISTPLRVKIIYLLCEEAMTAKQVADELGKTAGSIHYHVQQLYKGGILDLVETRENKGIIEKYYRSKATQFNLNTNDPERKGIRTKAISLEFTDEELADFEEEYDNLLEKWLKKTVAHKEGRTSFTLSLEFKKDLTGEDV
ncbi:winged helix-turn-helix domain-containing protein [Bacillus sp. FJAT-27245]|uniref:winged helix-turn-helix domain-containing protein n=1 Tax=Bacillus sp. FJAT-27245 TaxID=1684144 RepID=UPI0006A79316|nr:winged helix-turn-helix domain-containing protein [Bacillus sp. FJAT-27245]